MKVSITVLIVEDQAMVASGLQALLATFADVVPVGVAHTVAAAVAEAAATQPNVVLMDYRLPDGVASDHVAAIRACCDAKVLMLSATADMEAVTSSLAAGASGFLLKEQPVEELVAAIQRVHRGERVIAPALMEPLLYRLSNQQPEVTLTPRQQQVLQLLADGCSTQEMAGALGVSVNTIRNQVQAAIGRLGAHSKLEAVARGMRSGIIKPPKAAS